MPRYDRFGHRLPGSRGIEVQVSDERTMGSFTHDDFVVTEKNRMMFVREPSLVNRLKYLQLSHWTETVFFRTDDLKHPSSPRPKCTETVRFFSIRTKSWCVKEALRYPWPRSVNEPSECFAGHRNDRQTLVAF